MPVVVLVRMIFGGWPALTGRAGLAGIVADPVGVRFGDQELGQLAEQLRQVLGHGPQASDDLVDVDRVLQVPAGHRQVVQRPDRLGGQLACLFAHVASPSLCLACLRGLAGREQPLREPLRLHPG